jgi:aconitase A
MYFDQVIEIDLSTLEPAPQRPLHPDLATPMSEMKEKVPRMAGPPTWKWA